jgi:anti-sigma B factor antagonist
MNLKETITDKAIVIEIEGRLDTTNFSQLENKIMAYVDAGKINILVDCTNMDYVSSSGLRIFLMSLKKITSLNGQFVLCGLQENIQEIFEISGFTSIFKIYDNQEKALHTF